MRALARLRVLRRTALNPFRYSAERRWERKLLRDYEADLDLIAARLTPDNLSVATALAAYPQRIRGFGHVKEAQARAVLAERERLIQALHAPAESPLVPMAAE